MNNEEINIKKKRGRKPKQTIITDNDTDILEEEEKTSVQVTSVQLTSVQLTSANTDPIADTIEPDELSEDVSIKTPKKRGRKPKGGKIIVNSILEDTAVVHEPNIILHLKCKFSDLENGSLAYDYKGVDAFQFEKNKGNELGYHIIDQQISTHTNSNHHSAKTDNYESDFKLLCNKLKNMSYNLQNNNI
jgi:hypothetical protein